MKITLVFGAVPLVTLFISAAAVSLDDWQWRSPTPQGNDLKFVDRLDGGYFAAGEFTTMVRSGDGTNWLRVETKTLPEQTQMRGVAYGNAIYVCVGDFNNLGPYSFLTTSSNGFDWELPQRVRFGVNSAVTFGNGKFLALVGGDRGIHSVDGLTWTPVSLPADVVQLKFLNGRFCAFGHSFSTSRDAANWEVHAADLPSPYPLQHLAYGNGVWVGTAGGPQGSDYMIVRSTDGTNWTSYVPEPFNPNAGYFSFLTGVAYGNARFVVLGYRSYPGSLFTPILYTSPDGLTWTAAAMQFPERPMALCWDGSRFIAVGGYGAIAQSFDGLAWTALNNGTSRNFRNVAFANNQFIAVGNDGLIVRSEDGVGWTQTTSPGTGSNLRDVIHANGLYVAVAGSARALTSYDGDTWVAHSMPGTIDVFALAYGQGQFVAVGGEDLYNGNTVYSHFIMSSTDGTNWTTRASGTQERNGFQLHDIAYGDGLFVAVGRPGTVVTSPDGIGWDTLRLENSDSVYLKSVAYGNGRFVVVGTGANAFVRTSAGWTAHPIHFANMAFNSVTFAAGEFIAVGERGIVYSSPDGETWTRRANICENDLRGVAFGKDSFVVVGNNNTILQTLLAPRLQATRSGTSALLHLVVDPMRTYRVEEAADVTGGWTDFFRFYATTWGTNLVVPLNENKRFFRVRAE